jgi:hypothetical protein
MRLLRIDAATSGKAIVLPVVAMGLGAGIEAVPTTSFELGALIVALFATTLGAHLISRRRRNDALSLISVSAVFYLVAFGGGGIYAWIRPPPQYLPGFDRADLTVALAIGLAGWICLAGGYFADFLRPLRAAFPTGVVGIRTAGVALWPILVPLLTLGWGARFALLEGGRYFHSHVGDAPAPSGSAAFIEAISHFPTLALALAGAYAYLGSEAPGQARSIFRGLLLLDLAWYVPTGSKAAVLGVVLTVLVVRYYGRRRLPPKSALIVGVIFDIFVFFPFAQRYRAVQYQTAPGAALNQAAHGSVDTGFGGSVEAGFQSFSRLSDVIVVARIVNQGRDRLDHSMGNIVTSSLEAFVPRAVLRDKVDPGPFGNTFGQAYGFLNGSDTSTSVGITQLGELYLAAGWFGVSLGMFFIGAILRMIDSFFASRQWNRASLAIYATVLPTIVLGFETTIPLALVGALRQLVFLVAVLAVVLRLASPREPRQRRAAVAEDLPESLATTTLARRGV